MRGVCNQINHTYGFLKRSNRPLQLWLTSYVDGGLFQQALESHAGQTNWKVCLNNSKVEFIFTRTQINKEEKSYLEIFGRENVIYLSPDSPNILEELDENIAYIIGGIADHNKVD